MTDLLTDLRSKKLWLDLDYLTLRPQLPEDGTIYFRYAGYWTWSSGPIPCIPHITLDAYRVMRRTPKGCWISDYNWPTKLGERFVLDNARRKHAYPTRSEAWDSFVIRQRKRLQHAKNQLEGVTALLHAIEEITNGV